MNRLNISKRTRSIFASISIPTVSITFFGQRLQLTDNLLVSLLELIHFRFNLLPCNLFMFQLLFQSRNLRLMSQLSNLTFYSIRNWIHLILTIALIIHHISIWIFELSQIQSTNFLHFLVQNLARIVDKIHILSFIVKSLEEISSSLNVSKSWFAKYTRLKFLRLLHITHHFTFFGKHWIFVTISRFGCVAHSVIEVSHSCSAQSFFFKLLLSVWTNCLVPQISWVLITFATFSKFTLGVKFLLRVASISWHTLAIWETISFSKWLIMRSITNVLATHNLLAYLWNNAIDADFLWSHTTELSNSLISRSIWSEAVFKKLDKVNEIGIVDLVLTNPWVQDRQTADYQC